MNESPRFIIFHGTAGSPDGNWFPWLAAQLRQLQYEVLIPTFPTPENQSLDQWLKAFEAQVGELSKEMILIGHSMGVGMILRLLESTQEAVTACFLVSGWEGLLGLSDFDPLIESFYREPFQYQGIREKLGVCYQYHSRDDPYVPLQMGQELAEQLGSKFTTLEGAGHINAEAGFLQFPLLLEDIRNFLKEGAH